MDSKAEIKQEPMNYRHAFHAGNFADVLKHIVVERCLSHLGKKTHKPFAYIDTHAGVGRYDLTSEAAERSPEWVDGIGRILGTDIPDEVESILSPWLDLVKQGLEGDRLTAYPGSPELAAKLTSDQDRVVLCELHKADSITLDQHFARDRRVKVHVEDGYQHLSSSLPPREKRGLVLIDPPFEHPDEMAHMAEAVVSSLPKFPTGTYVFWRPLKDAWAAERFDVGLAEWLLGEQKLAAEKLLRADLWVRDLETEGKLAGAGVVIVNPPYTLEADLLKILPWLCDLLKQEAGAGWRLDGILNEDALLVEEF